MTGAPYSVSIAMPLEGFELTAGDPVIGGLHGEIQHNHCPYCLSWVFTRLPGIPMVNVRATMLCFESSTMSTLSSGNFCFQSRAAMESALTVAETSDFSK